MSEILKNSLDIVSQGLFVPVMIILIVLIAFALFCIGSIVCERFTERNHYSSNMPEFLQGLNACDIEDAGRYISNSNLLARQKNALLAVFDNKDLPDEARFALAKKEASDMGKKLQSRIARTDIAGRLAPMFGLMGTLIPLGPGIVALGNGDVAALAASIGVAFNTTVAGLVAAAVFIVISRIRRAWYEDYNTSLEAAMTTLLEKIEDVEYADFDEFGNPIAHSVSE